METLSAKKAKRMEVDFYNPYPPFPRQVFFDLNNTCNCRCIFCGSAKITKRAYLDKKLGFKLLQDFFDNGTKEIDLAVTGEPFLRKDLADFVAKAKKIGYEYIFIDTNGILANPECAKPVLDAGLDSVKVSINAGKRESYLKVQGVDAFDTVIKNIKWLHDYRQKSGLSYCIYASMVPLSITDGEFPILQKLILDYVDEIDYRGCSNQGGNMLENNLTEKINKRNLLGSLKKEQYTNRCPDIFFRAIVTPEGFLSACVVDYQNYLIVADLNKTYIKDAWNNEAYVSLRKKHISGNLKGLNCHNCLNNCQEEVQPLLPGFARTFKKEVKNEK
ncbi:MAG: radical SAM/SPASM domain-containing protein [Candidatus Omnitrophota bacterium]